MEHGRRSAEKIWARVFADRGFDSFPLIVKWYAQESLTTEAFLHTADESTPPDVFTSHFTHPRALEMFRRLMMFFQEYLPDLRTPAHTFNPTALSFGTTMVSYPFFVS